MLVPKGSSARISSRFKSRDVLLTLAVVALAPLILTSVFILSQTQAAYRAKVVDHLEVLVQKHAEDVDRFLGDRLSDIRIVAREHPMNRLMDPVFLRTVLGLLREEYGGAFVDLGLVDANGIQVAYAGPFNLALADYSAADWFGRTREREHFISDVFAGLRGTPHFIVAASRRHDGERYIVKATIDFEAFNALVENIRIGRTGFAFIFNREGEFQTKPRYDVALNRSPYVELLEGQARPGQIATREGLDLLGRKSIFTMAPLKQGEWFLCFQQERADAFRSLREAQTVALTTLSGSAAVILLLSYYLSRYVTWRLAEAESQKTIMSDKVIETGRLASIGELAAGIAHEINNPVAIMVEEAGWVEDLLGDPDPASQENLGEIRRAVRQIRTQGDRCKDITYKLLSFARKTDPTVREVDLNDLVAEVIGVMGQKTRYANVHIETHLAGDMAPVHASRTELQQVLLNLVNNAVDAIGPEGGTVTVTTRQEDRDLVLEVADTGSGIPEANLQRIFDPFFTTKAVGQGTGLGLSICYGIVDKLGGHISVDSEVEKGTTFAVRLPMPSAGEPEIDRGDHDLRPAEPQRRGEES